MRTKPIILCWAMVAGVAAGLLTAGCEPPEGFGEAGPPEDEAEERDYERADGDWLIMRMPSSPEHLNPYTSTDAYAMEIGELIFDGLLERNPETLEMEPNLAHDWEISDDNLEYTFHLRDDVVFHDGEPMTAEDVKFSFDTILDPEVMAPHLRNYLEDIVEVEVIDDYTVRIECEKPYFRHLVMIGGTPIVPEHIYGEGNFNQHPNDRDPIGSGPYEFDSWRTGQRITLTRYEDYWGEKPSLERRLFMFITEDNSAFQVLLQGNIDTMEMTPELWVNRAQGERFEQSFRKYTYYQPRYSYIGWNMRRPQFEDKRVRRAMTMLLDRDEILDTIYHGLGEVITGNFFIKNPEYNEEIDPLPFDPERAQELLDEAGWEDSTGDGIRDKDGESFEFELLIPADSQEDEQIATVFQQELSRAGIRMRIRRLEFATLLENVHRREFDAVRLGWSMPPDPDPYQVWHSSQTDAGSNYVNFVNEEADEIIEEARVEFDEDRRTELYRRFHEIVHEEQPYTFMYCRETLLAVDRRFRGIEIYPYGPYMREWFVPEELQQY
ncbi:MAG: peptide-binding protein [Candidatus Hydrogenedentota bacterium]